MNRADALDAATKLLIAEVEASLQPGAARFDAAEWAHIVLALRFAGPAPIVVEVAR